MTTEPFAPLAGTMPASPLGARFFSLTGSSNMEAEAKALADLRIEILKLTRDITNPNTATVEHHLNAARQIEAYVFSPRAPGQ